MRTKLKNNQQLSRFYSVRSKYSEICNLLLGKSQGSKVIAEGYDWSNWVRKVRQAFKHGVPLGFLDNSVLKHTMVYAKHHGIKETHKRILIVSSVFSDEVSKTLLREDYIGLPTITNVKYLTSANRSHHAMHLAFYTKEMGGHNFWDCGIIIEWGGGYGNMARLIRKMNPSVTYIIIDLPEILALQYVYLASLECEDTIHLIRPEENFHILPGKINLVAPNKVIDDDISILCDAFVSTWGLTESPQYMQAYVKEHKFFGAKQLLVASSVTCANNYLARSLPKDGLKRIAVPISGGVEPRDEYWFR
jgi:hypothetical protein